MPHHLRAGGWRPFEARSAHARCPWPSPAWPAAGTHAMSPRGDRSSRGLHCAGVLRSWRSNPLGPSPGRAHVASHSRGRRRSAVPGTRPKRPVPYHFPASSGDRLEGSDSRRIMTAASDPAVTSIGFERPRERRSLASRRSTESGSVGRAFRPQARKCNRTCGAAREKIRRSRRARRCRARQPRPLRGVAVTVSRGTPPPAGRAAVPDRPGCRSSAARWRSR